MILDRGNPDPLGVVSLIKLVSMFVETTASGCDSSQFELRNVVIFSPLLKFTSWPTVNIEQ
jgi:hypothetical protein